MAKSLTSEIEKIKNRETYAEGGFKKELGFGNSPCVITIDLQKSSADPDAPRTSKNIEQTVENTNEIIETAREVDIPMIHVRAKRLNNPEKTDLKIGRYKERNDGLKERKPSDSEFHENLDVKENDLILEKSNPSAFHGTQLQPILTANEIDTPIFVGCNASGCVRATVVDAVQNGFRTVVVPKCITDRTEEQKTMALVDFDLKYADVMSSEEVIDQMESY